MSDTSSRTDTYNKDDIQRVFASFAADYKMVAEWTKLHSRALVDERTSQIRALAESEYLDQVHLQRHTASGAIPDAVIYRVSTKASTWSADRPSSLKWQVGSGDTLRIVVFFSKKWTELPQSERNKFSKEHLKDWDDSDFNGEYEGLVEVATAKYSSRGYGLERTQVGHQ